MKLSARAPSLFLHVCSPSVMWERSIGSLISHVFEGRTATGSGPFSLLIQYALTLPNLYCYLSLLLKRRFAQEFVETHRRRVQKDNFPFTCVAQKKKKTPYCSEKWRPVDVLFKIHVSLASHFTFLFIYLTLGIPISKFNFSFVAPIGFL